MIGDQKISAVELAYVLDLTPTRVRQLTTEKILSCEKGRRGRVYEVKTAIGEYVAYKLESEVATPELAELQRQRARKLAADAERAEFNLQVLRRQYLLCSAVAKVSAEESQIVKSRIFGLGPRLCRILAPQSDPDEICEILDQEARDICASLVSDFTAQVAEANRLLAEPQGELEHAA